MKKEDYDFNNAPIGTKLTLSDGEVVVKDGATSYENEHRVIDRINDSRVYDIIKIEEPQYKTVYVKPADILDNIEKQYLKDVIKPFKNRVLYILKRVNNVWREYITIVVDSCYSINLPFFEKGTMYKNMVLNKHYTLEDLDIK